MERIYSKTFSKHYQKLDSSTKERIWEAIQKLPEGQYIKLKGNHTPPLYRLRVGKYRVIFEITETCIRFIDVDSRGDIYKSI